ncbi:MBL fold metallo-hydrolase [Synechococcus sp. CS-1329]|uniref:rhodanese-like domain-containing protein n=1 Tax=Synechococcus sp. CS-1329 TaxID=2847975 RepID=UPI00223AF43B|nr:MBL fold metallo-hydrolase [Synechococcus sp. CS-1329]MCT0218601.1 MBL fold metallo-hydrolase [Synechococcus sp. CS-1329]
MVVAPASSFCLAAAAGGAPLLFRQLFDADTGTFTYLIAEVSSGQALLIDSVYEQHERDLALIQELGLQLVACLDTHAHADHVTGSWLMHAASGSAIALAASVGAENVTLPLRHGDRVDFGGRALEVRATPGHTDGCLTFVLDDHSLAFSGDALLVRGCGRCDFQQGNARTLYHSITEQILSLPEGCLLYPGHDYTGRSVTSVTEEKAYNARLGGRAIERDFVIYMQTMKLPHPHRIAEALPANMRSGKPREGDGHGGAAWAPTRRSYAGLPELAPAWVAAHREEINLVDVRSPQEFQGPDGHIPGSLLIPLPELEQRAGEIPSDRPTVVLCHSGSRSALATQQLLRAGHRQVANLHGGLLSWQAAGYPLVSVTPL